MRMVKAMGGFKGLGKEGSHVDATWELKGHTNF